MSRLSDKTIHHLRELVEQPELDGTKYRCVRKIASGGMSTVFLAEDTQLNRNVALKILDLSNRDSSMVERIKREAQVIASLEHPGIVPIHDIGSLADGRIYYTMKFVHGNRLDQFVNSSPPLPNRLRVFQKVCEAVAFAHDKGVIHRDLKPENIMVADYGEVLVMDWGLAKVIDSERDENGRQHLSEQSPKNNTSLNFLTFQNDSNATLAGTIMGTPTYMAPEQASGKIDEIDERSDVYALGAILYFILTGQHPSKTQNLFEENLPREIDSAIPKSVEAICLKAMSQQKEARYAGVLELTGDVERFLNGLAVSSYQENIFERIGRWANKHKFIILLVLMYLVMRYLVYFLTRP